MAPRRESCAMAGGVAVGMLFVSGGHSFVGSASRPSVGGFLSHLEQQPGLSGGASSKASAGTSTLQLAAGGVALLACAQLATRVQRRASSKGSAEAVPRRIVALGGPSAAATALVSAEPAFAELAPEDLPAKIKADPYELIGMTKPDDQKEDKKEFYMKKQYREDTYQVLKHMKISGSLDKGTPNMEKWNKRVKEEMNDWVALYRRQDAVVGRQSYYALYSAVNTLASHFTSYGTKFPFPNKRRPRFYELINQTERFLEKNK